MRLKKYILPLLFLVSVSIVAYYIFLYLDIVPDGEKRVTSIFAVLGLAFGIFQFWVSEVNNKVRLDYELRYDAYRELNRTIQEITEKLNAEMGSDKEINPHGLVTGLLNLINQFQDTVKTNDDFLFPGLQYKNSFKVLTEITLQILKRTDKFRKNLEDIQKKQGGGTSEVVTTIERMNWHNETRELLAELHNKKYEFYKDIKGYL